MDILKSTSVKSPARAFQTLIDALEKKIHSSRFTVQGVLNQMVLALKSFSNGTGAKGFATIIKNLNAAITKLRQPSTLYTTPKYVEMGDGLKWATCNVGASKPEESGDYFAWGETKPFYTKLDPITWKEGRAYYGYEYNKHFIYDKEYTSIKYNGTDNKKVLEAADDAARAKYGGKWRTPTAEEWEALLNENNFTWTKEQKNGVEGFTVTSKVKGYQGNSIFLPWTKHFIGSTLLPASMQPGYWASTVYGRNDDKGLYGSFITLKTNGLPIMYLQGRYMGYPVRAVSE